MRLAFCLFLTFLVAACGVVHGKGGGDVLVIGDSVLAWNRLSGQDAGRQIEAALDRRVVSRATPGARLLAGRVAAIGVLSIPGQLSGRWNWVVINGGANDLGLRCNCGPCSDEIDALIASQGGGGAIPELITRARAGGAQVLWVGYYNAPESRGFRGCRPALDEVERRIAALAARRPGVHFIDLDDVLDPTQAGLLAQDRTHPSPVGSALIGRFIAEKIAGHTAP